MHYRLKEIFSRVFPEEHVISSGLISDEAFLVTEERLLVYSSEGWIDEFLISEIDCEIVETKHDLCIQIIDLTDPTAQCYTYYGLYKGLHFVVDAFKRAGISVHRPLISLPEVEVS